MMKKSYNKFFALSISASSALLGYNLVGGTKGVLLGLAATTGIVLADKYLLNNKISETTISNIFPKKPKI